MLQPPKEVSLTLRDLCVYSHPKVPYKILHSCIPDRNFRVTVVSVSQELVALMQSSVVAASAGCIRNAVALRDPCTLTLSSGAPDALGLLGLLMKEKFQRLRLETKSLKLSQNSATLGTCSLQEVAASWLRSHAANVHGASSANCFPFSPTAVCPF